MDEYRIAVRIRNVVAEIFYESFKDPDYPVPDYGALLDIVDEILGEEGFDSETYSYELFENMGQA